MSDTPTRRWDTSNVLTAVGIIIGLLGSLLLTYSSFNKQFDDNNREIIRIQDRLANIDKQIEEIHQFDQSQTTNIQTHLDGLLAELSRLRENMARKGLPADDPSNHR
jgi:predicted PurR-regulated permease PerM